MDKDYILWVIREYANEQFREPRSHLKKDYFKRRSYGKWAVEVVMRNIETTEGSNPIVVVEDFICKMSEFLHRNHRAGNIFLIARDTAIDILDVLLAMK